MIKRTHALFCLPCLALRLYVTYVLNSDSCVHSQDAVDRISVQEVISASRVTVPDVWVPEPLINNSTPTYRTVAGAWIMASDFNFRLSTGKLIIAYC